MNENWSHFLEDQWTTIYKFSNLQKAGIWVK